ncbi:MAG: ADP-ribosylation family protein [Gemmataceae bacterium]
MRDRRRQLRELYGFDFPEDFFRFWEFVNRLHPLEPLHALRDFCLQLVGPFEILEGRFDNLTPRYSLLLHWRYYFDPPEFFTLLTSGGDDAMHWGYFLDEPPGRSRCAASVSTLSIKEMATEGEDLFEAVRLWLEEEHDDCERDRDEGMIGERICERKLAKLATLRNCLLAFGTEERREVGAAYTERYAGIALRNEDVIANTYDGMGIVAPPESYRPLFRSDENLWHYLGVTDDPLNVVKRARRMLRKGFPGTALKLGKDLWAIGGEPHTEYAYELLDAAYAALGREALRKVLRVHRENRELRSVDILDYE